MAGVLYIQESTESIFNGEKELEDVDEDMWGMTVLIVSIDFAEILSAAGRCECAAALHYVRFCFGAFCQVLNIGLQVLLLFYVNKYVASPAEHDVQVHYKAYHAEVFDPDRSFRDDLWHVWTGPAHSLCSMSLTKLTFTSSVMGIWTIRMLGEFRGVWRLQRRVWSLPSSPPGAQVTDMVQERRDGKTGRDTFEIVFFTCGTRLVLELFCVIPKAIIAAALWLVGCRWINATESLEDLITNTLALQFIIAVDELILHNFFPYHNLDAIRATKFAFPVKNLTHVERGSLAARDYGFSIWFAVLVFGWTYMYLHYFQEVLPDFKFDLESQCDGEWFLSKFLPICGHFESGCFPCGPPNGEPLLPSGGSESPSSERLLVGLASVSAASLLADIDLLPALV